MPNLRAVFPLAIVAAVVITGSSGCSSTAATTMQVGDCLRVGGPPDRLDVVGAACGSPESSFKVVEVAQGADECPSDVDSSYSTSAFDGSTRTVCLDVDWVVGGCMSVDPGGAADPYRVDCADAAAPHRQRATQILRHVADPNQCGSGMGYPYDERRFTVCVEGVT